MHKPKGGVMMVIIGGGGASGPTLSLKNDGKKKGCNPMISIPASALNANDESGEDISPEVGDNVTLNNVEGVVKSMNNGQAEVEILSVNGEAAEYVNKDNERNSARDSMLEDAMEIDKEAGYEE